MLAFTTGGKRFNSTLQYIQTILTTQNFLFFSSFSRVYCILCKWYPLVWLYPEASKSSEVYLIKDSDLLIRGLITVYRRVNLHLCQCTKAGSIAGTIYRPVANWSVAVPYFGGNSSALCIWSISDYINTLSDQFGLIQHLLPGQVLPQCQHLRSTIRGQVFVSVFFSVWENFHRRTY